MTDKLPGAVCVCAHRRSRGGKGEGSWKYMGEIGAKPSGILEDRTMPCGAPVSEKALLGGARN